VGVVEIAATSARDSSGNLLQLPASSVVLFHVKPRRRLISDATRSSMVRRRILAGTIPYPGNQGIWEARGRS
jgi:hypothetical protein